MKGEMEVEVLSEEPNERDALKKASRRAKGMMMTADEAKLFCENPNAARGNKHPAYPDDDYGELEV